MQTKVSVIIPVYNTKEFLPECIDSVLMQTYPNIEILLIDDGSTDGSDALCDTFSHTNSTPEHQMIVVHKENSGLADTRNCGILRATGEYLLFLDSDDYYISPTSIASLMENAERVHSDVLCFNYTRSKNDTPERSFHRQFSSNLTDLIYCNVYTSSACLKLIRRDVLLSQHIAFTKGQLSEDILFSGKLLSVPGLVISFLNEVVYYYRVRNTSITNTLKLKNITDLVSIMETLEVQCGVSPHRPYPPMDKPTENLLAYAAFQYATLLINTQLCTEPIPRALRDKIYGMCYLLQYNPKGIVHVIHLCVSWLGIYLTAWLMGVAFKWKQVLAK